MSDKQKSKKRKRSSASSSTTSAMSRSSRSNAPNRGYDRYGIGLYRFTGRTGKRMNEMKFFDTSVQNATFTATWTNVMQTGNLVEEGPGSSQMNGRKINVRKITCRCTLRNIERIGNGTNPPTNVFNANFCYRVVLIQDTQFNGTPPTSADIWADPLGNNDIRANLNLANSNRFKVLFEELLDMDTVQTFIVPDISAPQAVSTLVAGDGDIFIPPITTNYYNVMPQKCMHFKKNLRVNIPIEFTPQGGGRNINQIRTNNLSMWVVSDAAINNEFSMQFRIRYTD